MKRGRKPRDSQPGQQSRTRSRIRGEIAAPGDADTSAGRGAPETEHPAPSAPKRTAQAPKASHAWQAEMQTRMERNENTLLEVRNLLAQLVPVASQGQPPQNEGSSTPHVPGPPMQPGPSLPPHAEASTSRQCELGYGSSAAQALPASSAPSSAPWPSPASLTNCAGIDNVLSGLPRAVQDRVASFVSPCLPIHAQVSEKQKQKIWADEYVDLASLLRQQGPDSDSYSLSFSAGGDDRMPSISLAPRRKQSIISFTQWSQAFQVMMSVYLSQPARAADAPALLKCQQVMQDLAERGGDWRTYDESFRAMRKLQWDHIHWELWMKAVHPLPTQNNNGPVRPAFLGKARGHPAGSPRAKYCFAFNTGQPCSFRNCHYEHKCSRCQGHHPAHRCTGKGQGNGAATSTHYRQQ